MQNNNCYIHLNSVSLEYELHHDRTNNLKEAVINAITGRAYVKEKKERLLALNNINLKFDHGQRVGIIGLNGAGKSSLLKVISGIYKPTSGSVDIKGHIQPLIEIGAGFDPEFTGRENIYLNAYMLGFSKKQVMEKEQSIIDFTELQEFIDTPIKYYSSGMSVRLAFTIATMIEPEILVFDEMLSAGDAAFMIKAQQRMNKLLDLAKVMVIVSHDLNIIKNMCNRLIVLDKGTVMFDGAVDGGLEYYNELVKRNVNK